MRIYISHVFLLKIYNNNNKKDDNKNCADMTIFFFSPK